MCDLSEDFPKWVQVLILIVGFLVSLSEILPFTNRSQANGIGHGLHLMYKKSLRNIIFDQSEEKKNDK